MHILFGARQTGKSTLLAKLVGNPAIKVDFSDPGERSRYLKRPENLIAECRALGAKGLPHQIVIDEAQNVPTIFDSVQHLYDADPERYRFILCGSSARKLRVTGSNLLPGRALLHHLYPLILSERPGAANAATGSVPLATDRISDPFPRESLINRLAFGEFPGIALASSTVKAQLLKSYTTIYLQEELRREALIKDWRSFSRFLELAALESGQVVNRAAIARKAGISQPTVSNYYQLLEDMFIGFVVPAFSGSKRSSVLSTPRFFLLDTGLRNAAAELEISEATVLANPGPLFEQWVGIELWKRVQYRGAGRLSYLRTKGGMEIDFILELAGSLVPIEVKWTEQPDTHDARHLRRFLADHPQQANHGYIVCRCKRPMAISDNITAIPWHDL